MIIDRDKFEESEFQMNVYATKKIGSDKLILNQIIVLIIVA